MPDKRRFPAWLIALALFALAFAFAIAFLMLGPGSAPDTRDYAEELNAQIEAELAGEQSAWPRYVPILREWNETYADDHHVRRTMQFLLRGDWSDERHEPNLRALDRVRPIVMRTDALADIPSAARPYAMAASDLDAPGETEPPEIMADYLMPSLRAIRGIAIANAAMLREAAEQDDWDEATRRARTGLALSRHAADGRTLIEWLVGVSIQGSTLSEVRHAAMLRDIPPDAAEAIAAVIRNEALAPDDFPRTLRGERQFTLDLLRAMHDGSYSHAEQDMPGWLRHIAGLFRARDYRLINEQYEQALAWWDAPYAEKQALTETREHPALGFARTVMPGLSRVSVVALEAQTTQAATLLMLRLEIFRAQNNRWPDTLAEAVGEPGALDPVSGLPFDYEVLTDDPDGRPYELRAPSDAWHFDEKPRTLNHPRPPLPETDPYADMYP